MMKKFVLVQSGDFMNRAIAFFLLFVGLLVQPTVHAEDSVGPFEESSISPEDGIPSSESFTWVRSNNLKVKFLKPIGWYDDEKQLDKGTWSIAISREDTRSTGRFLVGEEIRIGKVPDQAIADVDGYIAQVVDQMATSLETLSRNTIDFGFFKGQNITFIMQKEKLEVFALLIANRNTKTYYMFTFQAPIADFPNQWNKLGNIMNDYFIIDDQI